MSFYQKYRYTIFITIAIFSSVVIAIAIDKIMKRKRDKKLKESGSFTANKSEEFCPPNTTYTTLHKLNLKLRAINTFAFNNKKTIKIFKNE
jgi:hypothetical protein